MSHPSPDASTDLMATALEAALLHSLTPIVTQLSEMQQQLHNQAQAIAQLQSQVNQQQQQFEQLISVLQPLPQRLTTLEEQHLVTQTHLNQHIEQMSQLQAETKSLSETWSQLLQKFLKRLSTMLTSDKPPNWHQALLDSLTRLNTSVNRLNAKINS